MLVYTEEGLGSGFLDSDEAAGSHLLSVSVPEGVDAEGTNLALWCTDIPFGVYEADISYSASYDTSEDNKPVLKIVTFDEAGDIRRFSDDVYLYEHVTAVRSRIYMGRNDGPFYSFFSVYGSGETVIDSFTIREYKPWRALVFLAVFAVFLLADLLIIYIPTLGREKAFTLLMLSFLGVIISVPLMYQYSMHGHDAAFHMYRVGSLGDELRSGQFPVRYMSGAYFGHGYIIDIFYANIFLLPSAILYLLGFPLYAAYNSFLILTGLVTVAASFYSFRGVFGSAKAGVLGAYIYTFSMYRLCDLYVRSDAGELCAMAFLPLVIFGLHRIYTSEKRDYRNCIPLIVGAFGLVQSHILTVLLTIFFILIFAICFIKITLKKLPELIFSAVSLLILDLFYLVPVFASFIGMGMSTGRAALENTADNALILSRIFDLWVTYREPDKTVLNYNDMLFSAGPVALAGALLFIGAAVFALAKKKEIDKNSFRVGVVCLCLAGVAAFISSNLFPWEKISGMGGVMSFFTSMQFPWRFMEIADPLVCFAAVAGIVMVEKAGLRKSAVNCIIGTVMTVTAITGISYSNSYRSYYYEDRNENRDNYTAIRPDWTYFPEGLNRYLSQDTGVKLADGEVIPQFVRGEAPADAEAPACEILTGYGSEKSFRIVNPGGECKVVLPVFALDNMVIRDVENRELTWERTPDCRMKISIPAGTDITVRACYETPFLWRMCDIISFLGLVTLVAFFCKNSKKSP